MAKVIQTMDKCLSRWAEDGLEGVAGPDAPDVFNDPPLKKHRDKYGEKNARALTAVCAKITGLSSEFEMRLQQALAATALAKMQDLAAVLLEDGKYGKPTAQQRTEMASTLPVN